MFCSACQRCCFCKFDCETSFRTESTESERIRLLNANYEIRSTHVLLQDPGVPEELPLRHTWIVWQQLASPGKSVPYEQSTKQTPVCISLGCAGVEPRGEGAFLDSCEDVDDGLVVRINTATQDCVHEFGGGIVLEVAVSSPPGFCRDAILMQLKP